MITLEILLPLAFNVFSNLIIKVVYKPLEEHKNKIEINFNLYNFG